MKTIRFRSPWQLVVVFTLALSTGTFVPSGFAQEKFTLQKGDHVVYIGNTMADRMQHHAWLETQIHALHPMLELTVRNIGFAADEVKTRPRSQSFGSPDQWLSKCEADVILCFFGYNESLKGEAGLAGFRKDLAETIDGMLTQRYNGKSSPRLVFFSPIAHENLKSPHLPDGTENNRNLALYTRAMKEVCGEKKVRFVDLFQPTLAAYAKAEKPLTMNGIHLLDHGNRVVADVIARELFGEVYSGDTKRLRDAILDKNYHWFSRYRVVDGYNVYGGRSKLAWHGQSNADVMKREMEIFDVMTRNRDQRVWSVAQGGNLQVKDDNLPPELDVKTNKPGKLEDGRWEYLDGNKAIERMTVHQDMEINLFASEKEFPRLINPVQLAVDTDSRLWVSVWPSYPHWNPTQKREDALLILPDDDQDGKADRCVVFADELNSITAFEFWNGGVLVAAPPEIWFLKDTDGDDKADVKIRMLQGVSSADTHHSANAMVIGPDGWMYYSRGIFNVANFETPTRTFRSGASGVHRFNPRTFEFEFHFPIGPNPHGDVFDQWGYQFANDGTGGTGSYVNLGKGIGNKKWFKKRVRPVPATGILSSGHFSDDYNGNFLICNAIGDLGVYQHEVTYAGADIMATEIEPIVFSKDPNFRPSDVEMGGDGALYISDWHNTLIGHMQHNMRDPNRDQQHGRVYRVTQKNRKPVPLAKMKGKPIAEVCRHLLDLGNAVRYRARLELSGRSPEAIRKEVGAFAASLDPAKGGRENNQAQALLECLWVFEEQRIVNMPLLSKVFKAAEPRVRAAAIRTMGHWAGRTDDWQELLLTAARDESPLVRAEALKAAVEFEGYATAEAIFEAATRQLDPELETVLKYAKSRINVDAVIADAQSSGKKLSAAAQAYVLVNASVDALMKMEKSEAVYRAIISRKNANSSQLAVAMSGLAKLSGQPELEVILATIEEAQSRSDINISALTQVFADQPIDRLGSVKKQIEAMATRGKTAEIKRLGYAAWVAASGPDDAFLNASKNKENLRDFLDAVPSVNRAVRNQLFDKVLPLISSMPAHLEPEPSGSDLSEAGIKVDYYYPSASNVALETLARMKPKASGVVPQIVMNVPQRKQADKFALKFTGNLVVPKAGKYTFYIASDDGSRIYLDGKLLINHDGMHGMTEKNATINLAAGTHALIVSYFDNGGGDGLRVTWAGPGFTKQAIPPKNLVLGGRMTLHDVAIEALAAIPGREKEKFTALTSLIAKGRNRPTAIKALARISQKNWPAGQVGPLVDNLVGYLSSMPARYRTGGPAQQAADLTRKLAEKLTPARKKAVLNRLNNLDVRVIAIGTVPHRMIYDKEMIVVEAGKTVEFRFSNTDSMPHNFAITRPGALQEVGELGEATGRDEDAAARHYIPKSDKVLLGSELVQPGDTQAISFQVPSQPGVYPYVCTYPGHWRRMYGALYVVKSFEEYQINPQKYLAENPVEIRDNMLNMVNRNRDWKYDELIADVQKLPMGRSWDVGKELFKVASCTGCHKMNGEGNVFGPDLTKLDAKKGTTEHILRSILEPSRDIDEKYQSFIFALDSGRQVTGMVVEENDDQYKIVIDPLAKDKATVLSKEEVEAYKKSKLSLMPSGLMNKLTREEILDLVAYVFAKGDKKHMLFKDHHDH
ncbi:MAG: PVC-type heme-binding CxxCH protein [Planctomycetota bacterium]|nr:PVC-type heme-binding CxxCH protein [Planctomycetota bacterium]